jgi:hypothetical protein
LDLHALKIVVARHALAAGLREAAAVAVAIAVAIIRDANRTVVPAEEITHQPVLAALVAAARLASSAAHRTHRVLVLAESTARAAKPVVAHALSATGFASAAANAAHSRFEEIAAKAAEACVARVVLAARLFRRAARGALSPARAFIDAPETVVACAVSAARLAVSAAHFAFIFGVAAKSDLANVAGAAVLSCRAAFSAGASRAFAIPAAVCSFGNARVCVAATAFAADITLTAGLSGATARLANSAAPASVTHRAVAAIAVATGFTQAATSHALSAAWLACAHEAVMTTSAHAAFLTARAAIRVQLVRHVSWVCRSAVPARRRAGAAVPVARHVVRRSHVVCRGVVRAGIVACHACDVVSGVVIVCAFVVGRVRSSVFVAAVTSGQRAETKRGGQG